MTRSLALHDVAVKSDDNVMSTTRRLFLSALPGLAAASAVPTVLGSPNTAHAASEASLAEEGIHENPDLLRAYDALIAARAELAAAEDALEWLADEWRHLWPLAPEELLFGANAHRGYWRTDNAERDIIGRFMMRDTADLTKRLTRQFRKQNEKQCFHLCTSTEAEEHIANLSRQTPKGRTEKALARNRAWIEDSVAYWKQRLALAEKYEAETARLRKAAGVDDAKRRITITRNNVWDAEHEVSMIPVFTLEGLRIKAEAIRTSEISEKLSTHDSPLGDMMRLCLSVLDVAGRTSA